MRRASQYALVLLAMTALPTGSTSAQPTSPRRSAAGQPKIIVIPFTKEKEDIRTVLEADFTRQLAVARVKKAFDARKFSTVDFEAAVAAMMRNRAMATLSESDFRDRLLETYKADIYVIVNYRATVDAGMTSVAVIMDSYMTANALSLSTETARSRRNREPDVSAHVELAIDEMSPDFLNGIQEKFDEFQVQGVPLAMTVRIASGSAIDLNTKPKGQSKTIADLLEDWALANAVEKGVAVGMATANTMEFTDVRIPVRESDGAPLSPRRFGSRVTSYLESLGVTATASVSNGAIYVDIR